MDLPCFLKARALVRLRVSSYCGCGHTRLDRRLAQGVSCARAALVSHGAPRAESVAKRLVVKKSPTYSYVTMYSGHVHVHHVSSIQKVIHSAKPPIPVSESDTKPAVPPTVLPVKHTHPCLLAVALTTSLNALRQVVSTTASDPLPPGPGHPP